MNPTSRYYGEFTPENLAFNANLQEFANRIGIICNLETGGKVTPEEAYAQVRHLWRALKESKKALLNQPSQPRPELPPEE
jgi:hypothetical protein